ncbi:MAG TPA: M15 family metallopeptidase [Acidimicrobiales bacterium]|nr:M15 family metallopeptidase [Acidimicrobiales bacterium]
MAHPSWGSGWPNCSRSNIVTLVRADGLRLPVHRELADLVSILMDLTEIGGGYDIVPGWTWGFSCLAGETEVMTPDGDVPIADLAGTTARLLTRQPTGHGGRAKWIEAPVRSFGIQPLMRVVLSRNGRERELHATADHRWFVQHHIERREDGLRIRHQSAREAVTADLVPGDRLASCWTHSIAKRTVPSPVGIGHGLVTGDGTIFRRHDRDGRGEARIALYGPKNFPLARFFPQSQPQAVYEDPIRTDAHLLVAGLPAVWKRPPSLSEGSSYLYGWLAGFFAADGRITEKGLPSIASVDRELLEAAEAVCRVLGIVTGGIRCTRKADPDRTPIMIAGSEASTVRAMHELSIDPRSLSAEFFVIPEHAKRWRGPSMKARPNWKVELVEPTDRVEEVYCAVVPKSESFALADHLLTGNCRAIAGTNQPSNHSWGTAIDLNAPVNPRKRPLTTNIPRAVRELWKAHGFRWGGDYVTSTPDAMHFEFMGTVADAHAIAARLRRFLAHAQPPPQERPRPSAPGEKGRIMDVQRLLRVAPDGAIGPNTVAAMNANLIGWPPEVRRRTGRDINLPGNANPNLVTWLQRQGRRKGYLMTVDGSVGPQTNHLIVVVLGQPDAICGANGYRAAVR